MESLKGKTRFLESLAQDIKEIKNQDDLTRFFKRFIAEWLKPKFKMEIPDINIFYDEIKKKNAYGLFKRQVTGSKTSEYSEYTDLNYLIGRIERRYNLIIDNFGNIKEDENFEKLKKNKEDYILLNESIKRVDELNEELKVAGYYKEDVYILLKKEIIEEFLKAGPRQRVQKIPNLMRTLAHEYRHYAQYVAGKTKTSFDFFESKNKDFEGYKIIHDYAKKATRSVIDQSADYKAEDFLILKNFAEENEKFFGDNEKFVISKATFEKIDAFLSENIIREYLSVAEYFSLEHEIDARMFSNDIMLEIEQDLGVKNQSLFASFKQSNQIYQNGERFRLSRVNEFYVAINRFAMHLGNDLLVEIARDNNFQLRKDRVNLMSFAEEFKAKQLLLTNVLRIKAKQLEKIHLENLGYKETVGFIKKINLELYKSFVKNGIAYGCESLKDIIGEEVLKKEYFNILKSCLKNKDELCEDSFYEVYKLDDDQNLELIKLSLKNNQFRYTQSLCVCASEREKHALLNSINEVLKERFNSLKDDKHLTRENIAEFNAMLDSFYSSRRVDKTEEDLFERYIKDKNIEEALNATQESNLDLYILKKQVKLFELKIVNNQRKKEDLKPYSNYEEYKNNEICVRDAKGKEKYLKMLYGNLEIAQLKEEKEIYSDIEL